jgi:hypothetical protein
VNPAQKLADTGPIVGWGIWALSHIAQINSVFQFVLLITSIVATVFSARYYYKKSK